MALVSHEKLRNSTAVVAVCSSAHTLGSEIETSPRNWRLRCGGTARLTMNPSRISDSSGMVVVEWGSIKTGISAWGMALKEADRGADDW